MLFIVFWRILARTHCKHFVCVLFVWSVMLQHTVNKHGFYGLTGWSKSLLNTMNTIAKHVYCVLHHRSKNKHKQYFYWVLGISLPDSTVHTMFLFFIVGDGRLQCTNISLFSFMVSRKRFSQLADWLAGWPFKTIRMRQIYVSNMCLRFLALKHKNIISSCLVADGLIQCNHNGFHSCYWFRRLFAQLAGLLAGRLANESIESHTKDTNCGCIKFLEPHRTYKQYIQLILICF